jgi:hypothetical protein
MTTVIKPSAELEQTRKELCSLKFWAVVTCDPTTGSRSKGTIKSHTAAGSCWLRISAEVVKDSRVISSKLIDGTGYMVDEVGAGFETVGHEIERVGARVTITKTVKQEVRLSHSGADGFRNGVTGPSAVD